MGDVAVHSAPEDRAGRTIVAPALHHFGIATTRPEEMIDWYRDVLGLQIVAQTTNPLPKMTFVTNDHHHHRGGFFSPPDLEEDGAKPSHARIQHLAWEYQSLDELL